MFDPVACAKLVLGTPCVDLTTLLELKQALIGARMPRESPSDNGFAAMKFRDLPTAVAGRQMIVLFDSNRLEGLVAIERSKVASALAQILMHDES